MRLCTLSRLMVHHPRHKVESQSENHSFSVQVVNIPMRWRKSAVTHRGTISEGYLFQLCQGILKGLKDAEQHASSHIANFETRIVRKWHLGCEQWVTRISHDGP